MRSLALYDCGRESPLETFSRDHVAICRVASARDDGVVRVWRAAEEGVSLGRFHRRAQGAAGLVRRLSGGRVVVVGPGVLGLTMILPSVEWLALGRGTPAPDQILNRTLRPVLALLRSRGIDAFYGGRDLVTWDRMPIAVASFTVLADGIVVVEVWISVSTSFDRCAALLERIDAAGTVAHDALAFANARPLVGRAPAIAELDWTSALAEFSAGPFACTTRCEHPNTAFDGESDMAPAYEAFQSELGPIETGWKSAAAVEMLGAVEAAARVEGGRIADFRLSGDVIAPFATLEELAAACRGQAPTRAAAERALLGVLARPGRFLLGVRDFGALVERLA